MKSFKILGETRDLRTNTIVLYAQINVDDYLLFVGDNYDKFSLQRKREQHKGYSRLKNDLEKGALIPPITLAVEPELVKKLLPLVEKKDYETLLKGIEQLKDNIYILDGLQRTHKIKESKNAGVVFKENHFLLIELWFEPDINHLLYRLIVLNSGQKPMSMRHQIELLFTTMRNSLTIQIPDLEIIAENDEEKRIKAKQMPFERLVTSYKCFLTGSPEVDKDTLVSEKMLEEKILDESEEYLSESFNSFKGYLTKYCLLDYELFRICENTALKGFRNWFADSNTINSFFAAIGKLHNTKSDRINSAIDQMLAGLKQANSGEDILSLNEYKKIKEDVADPKKYNVGFATRKLLTDSFNEYFRDEGNTSLLNCWITESVNIKNSKK
jgi:hypothetical protein